MNKKKFSGIIAAAALILTLGACSKTSNSGSSSNTTFSAVWNKPNTTDTVFTANGLLLSLVVNSPSYPVTLSAQFTDSLKNIPSTVKAWTPSSNPAQYTIESSDPNYSTTIPLDSTVAAGQYTLTATYQDAGGINTPTAITFNIKNSTDDVPPVLQVTGITNGMTVQTSGTIGIGVTISDNKRLGNLSIYLKNTTTGTITDVLKSFTINSVAASSPFDLTSQHGTLNFGTLTYSLSQAQITAGSYILEIIGKDAVNNTTENNFAITVN